MFVHLQLTVGVGLVGKRVVELVKVPVVVGADGIAVIVTAHACAGDRQ